MHCARALYQHFHRPPFAIMASDADWPPLPSERRSSAVYQPMVRLPTFRCVTPTYNLSAPAPAPLTNSYIQHNIRPQAPAARAVTTGGARGLPCRPEGGGRARPAGKACLLNSLMPIEKEDPPSPCVQARPPYTWRYKVLAHATSEFSYLVSKLRTDTSRTTPAPASALRTPEVRGGGGSRVDTRERGVDRLSRIHCVHFWQ